jgi:hypothetical protein
MLSKTLLIVCFIAVFATITLGESSLEKLKSKVNAGAAPAPCDKAPAGPPAPKQYLDQRLPHVVDDYHPPKGGFNPSHIPGKEVDTAARKILREIQAWKKERKEMGMSTEDKPDPNGVISTEEHKMMKQLLLDADILVRAASKSLAENGEITLSAKQVAASAINKSAAIEKKLPQVGDNRSNKSAKRK